jgi:hypothetical protein
MSCVWLLLAVVALSVIPIRSGFAASSSSASGNPSSGVHGVHKGIPKGGIGPARAIETPGPGAPGIAHTRPMIVPGKGSPKPPSTLRTLNGQGFNGPARGLGSQGIRRRGERAVPMGRPRVREFQGQGFAPYNGA